MKRNISITFLACVLSITHVLAQCGELDVELLVEDSLQLEELNGCDSIFGDLTISGSMISYLDALENLEYIGGDLTIDACFAILDVDGLGSLKYIGGDLVFTNNFTLLNITGLHDLEYLGGDLTLHGNWSLPNLDGLQNLTEIYGSVSLSDNNVMENVLGLENLNSITGDLIISNDNVILNDLEAFVSISTIGGDFNIQLNNLTSINGFSNLEIIGGDLLLVEVPILANVNGLISLATVDGTVTIHDNNTLVNLDGLENLTIVGGHLNVFDNPVLFLCCGLNELLSNGTVYGETTIENNAFDCGSVQEILDECTNESIFESIDNSISWSFNNNELMVGLNDSYSKVCIYNTIGQLLHEIVDIEHDTFRFYSKENLLIVELVSERGQSVLTVMKNP